MTCCASFGIYFRIPYVICCHHYTTVDTFLLNKKTWFISCSGKCCCEFQFSQNLPLVTLLMDSRFYLISILLGVLSEAALFSRGEWDRYAPDIVKASMALTMSVSILLWRICNIPFMDALINTCKHGTAAILGLFGSMIIYRLFFHPLRAFPGPFPAKISSWWIFKESIPDLKFYIKLRSLHERYGDFVRISEKKYLGFAWKWAKLHVEPREISTCHPDAIIDVHGPGQNMQKGELYDQSHPHQTLQFTRDSAFHRKKRVGWDRALQKNVCWQPIAPTTLIAR